jgi:hypothetical protein
MVWLGWENGESKRLWDVLGAFGCMSELLFVLLHKYDLSVRLSIYFCGERILLYA